QFNWSVLSYDIVSLKNDQYMFMFYGANWLGSFCQPVRSWNGLLLRRPIDMEKRDLIQRGEASLLDLRSYLFSRQCTLLIFLQRPWEVTARALELLHNCVQELRLLEVCVCVCVCACGVLRSVSCVWCVCVVCVCVMCVSSLSLCLSVNSPQSPYKKLKEALSSVEAFEKHYLVSVGSLKGDPQSAENFLLDSLKSYVSESWSLPLTHTRKQIAECQKQLQKMDEYPSLITERHLELRLCSLMPVPVTLEQIAVSIHFTQEQPGSTAQKRAAQNQDGTVTFPAASPASASASASALELCEILEHSPSDNTLSSAGVACKNMHLLMRRHDSTTSLDTPNTTPSAVAMEDGAQMLRASDVTLLPGNNSIVFIAPPGVYTLRQLCATLGRVQLVLPHLYPVVQYEVYSQEPQLSIQPLTVSHLVCVVVSEHLLAGLPQQVKFTILTGHYSVKKGDALQLSNTDSMPVLHSSTRSARILSSSSAGQRTSALSIQSSEKVTSISLPVTPPYHTLEFLLDVLCHIPSCPARMESERLTNGQISHRTRSRTRFNSDTHTHTHSLSHTLILKHTHTHTHTHTLIQSKFEGSVSVTCIVCVCVQLVFRQQCVFSVWELRWSGVCPVSLHCEFSASFAPADAPDTALKPYRYHFTLERVTIRPAAGEQHCVSGSLCRLEVSVTRLSEAGDSDEDSSDTDGLRSCRLLYEVIDNNSNWAVCGKSSGVVSMPVAAMATHKVHMEVMPLFAGHLPFPNIRVFKYLPHHASAVIPPDTDSCLENDSLSLDDQAETASLRSRGSVQSLGSGESAPRGPMPKRQAFGPGQVFNSTQGQQVLVLPAADHHVMEVNVT
uniref:Trafficking protein particle complex 10 n=1 Tax=Cyprinus carpio TaxID=7962 RepID=A0A8C1RAR2_CYPCA